VRSSGTSDSDHTLQATALVHEAYLRLVAGGYPTWNDRQHFFRAAAEAAQFIKSGGTVSPDPGSR
jgi:ECF sigma factor